MQWFDKLQYGFYLFSLYSFFYIYFHNYRKYLNLHFALYIFFPIQLRKEK